MPTTPVPQQAHPTRAWRSPWRWTGTTGAVLACALPAWAGGAFDWTTGRLAERGVAALECVLLAMAFLVLGRTSHRGARTIGAQLVGLAALGALPALVYAGAAVRVDDSDPNSRATAVIIGGLGVLGAWVTVVLTYVSLVIIAYAPWQRVDPAEADAVRGAVDASGDRSAPGNHVAGTDTATRKPT